MRGGKPGPDKASVAAARGSRCARGGVEQGNGDHRVVRPTCMGLGVAAQRRAVMGVGRQAGGRAGGGSVRALRVAMPLRAPPMSTTRRGAPTAAPARAGLRPSRSCTTPGMACRQRAARRGRTQGAMIWAAVPTWPGSMAGGRPATGQKKGSGTRPDPFKNRDKPGGQCVAQLPTDIGRRHRTSTLTLKQHFKDVQVTL